MRQLKHRLMINPPKRCHHPFGVPWSIWSPLSHVVFFIIYNIHPKLYIKTILKYYLAYQGIYCMYRFPSYKHYKISKPYFSWCRHVIYKPVPADQTYYLLRFPYKCETLLPFHKNPQCQNNALNFCRLPLPLPQYHIGLPRSPYSSSFLATDLKSFRCKYWPWFDIGDNKLTIPYNIEQLSIQQLV